MDSAPSVEGVEVSTSTPVEPTPHESEAQANQEIEEIAARHDGDSTAEETPSPDHDEALDTGSPMPVPGGSDTVPALTIEAPSPIDPVSSQRSRAASFSRSSRAPALTGDRVETTTSSRSIHDDARSTRSRPQSHLASTGRSRHETSRFEFVEDEPVVRDSAAFQKWAETRAPDEPYKIGPFVLLLLDEFCRYYNLTDTASAFQQELQELGVEFPVADLWFDMYGQCSSILSNKKHTSPLAAATTIERLIEFCVSPQARKAVFSLDMVAAHSPMHVCASPKRAPPSASSSYALMAAYQQTRSSPIIRPSQRQSSHTHADGRSHAAPPQVHPADALRREEPGEDEESGSDDNHSRQEPSSPSRPVGLESPVRKSSVLSAQKKKKKRKSRQHRSHSVVSVLSHLSGHHATSSQPQLTPCTYGEPVIAESHLTDLKRDLTSTRMLEKELRHMRLEKILTDPTIPTQKKLGFHTLTVEEARMRQQAQDPYANELILEKYGFSKRQECALCQFPFLQYNLPHKVSFKCIMDVYEHWNYTPPDRDSASKYKAPLCYDAVQVCRMCAQIVFQHAKQPEAQLLLAVGGPRPLSRKHRKAKSLANLRQPEPSDELAFCSDPYALPPLLGDDVYDHRDELGPSVNARRRGFRGDGDPSDTDGRAIGAGESPAKAIVYSQQVDGAPYMTAKEWEVINPDKSSTRHRIQASLAAAAPGRRHVRPPQDG